MRRTVFDCAWRVDEPGDADEVDNDAPADEATEAAAPEAAADDDAETAAAAAETAAAPAAAEPDRQGSQRENSFDFLRPPPARMRIQPYQSLKM